MDCLTDSVGYDGDIVKVEFQPILWPVHTRVSCRGGGHGLLRILGGYPPLFFAKTMVKSKLNRETCHQGMLIVVSVTPY